MLWSPQGVKIGARQAANIGLNETRRVILFVRKTAFRINVHACDYVHSTAH